jgi:DNA/RNA-binding domain of Phe-tRNA-synthetase-like protein
VRVSPVRPAFNPGASRVGHLDENKASIARMNLIIADPIFEDYPELILGVVIAHDIDNSQDRAEITGLLRTAETNLPAKFGDTPIIQHPYIATWREAYRKFGAKPKDYPSSVENLARRVLNGASLAQINNLVSLYNTISLKYILPVGGEDLDQILGDILLTRAGEAEPAIILLGEKEARPPHPGEIIYKDEVGAICRRWNWKEADRTKLTKETRNAFLVIEALPPVSRHIVETAIHELADFVKHFCGGIVSTAILDQDNRAIKLI